MAVLDSGCTKTVAGEVWLEEYIKMLSEADKKLVEYLPTKDVFRFGDGKEVVPSKKVLVPAVIGKKRVTISANVVDNKIPLLLSKKSMKLADTTMDFTKDEVTMLGETLSLATTASGHYCIPIYPTILQDDSGAKGKIILSDTDTFQNMTQLEKRRKAKKLHVQFAHASKERLEIDC